MFSKNKFVIFLLILGLISITSISMVSAAMNIHGGAFSTGGGLEDLTYASIDVGTAKSGDDVIIQIWYSRDGSILNEGNMVPITVNSKGFINVKSADPYNYFPDHAEINIYDENNNLLDSRDVDLSPHKGIQTFGDDDYDHSYIKGKDPNKKSKSKSNSGSTSATRSSSNSGKSGTKHMEATTSDKFFFFPLDDLASKSMYYASVLIDGEEYYLGPSQYEELCLYSNTFAIGYNQQLQFAESTIQLIELQGRAYETGTIITPPSGGDFFELNVDKNFSFDYKSGTVGLNKDAYIITKLYLDD